VHPADRFLRVKQFEKGLSPAGPAAASAVLRRISFVLTGLPPSLEQAQGFEAEYAADPSGAVERAVDGFSASPRFGEHWARHWMDLMRYSESHGSETDKPLPMAWQYRDYLVRAFNQDVPLDALIREHLAGDRLAKPRVSADGLNESSVRPAHFRMVEHGENAVDTREDQVRVLDNQIDVVGKAFQGMTIACARCHDQQFACDQPAGRLCAAGCSPRRILVSVCWIHRSISTDSTRSWRPHRNECAKGSPGVAERCRTYRESSAGDAGAGGRMETGIFGCGEDPAHPLNVWLQMGEYVPARWEALRKRVEAGVAAVRKTTLPITGRSGIFGTGRRRGGCDRVRDSEQKPEPGRFGVSESGDRVLGRLYPRQS